MQPFTRLKFYPSVDTISERVTRAAFCYELERGAQPGVRIALSDPNAEEWDRSRSVAFDKDGASVPVNGTTRVWIVWPASLQNTTQPLEITAWHLPTATYARDRGGMYAPMHRVLMLEQGDNITIAAGGFLDIPQPGPPAKFRGIANLNLLEYGRPVAAPLGTELYGTIFGATSQSWEWRLTAECGTVFVRDLERIVSVPAAGLGNRVARLTGTPLPFTDWRSKIQNLDGARTLTFSYQIGVRLRA